VAIFSISLFIICIASGLRQTNNKQIKQNIQLFIYNFLMKQQKVYFFCFCGQKTAK